MVGDWHGVLLVEHGEFGKHSIGRRRAEGNQRTAWRAAVDPPAKKRTRDPLADAEA